MAYTFNPFTGNLDALQDLSGYELIDEVENGTINRTSDLVSSVVLVKDLGTDTITVNRDGDGLVTSTVSVYNGVTTTTTYTRTAGVVTSFATVIS